MSADPALADRVRAIIVDQLNCGEAPDQSTFASLGADRFDGVELAMRLEEELNVQIDDELVEQTTTVGAAIAAIEALLEARAVADTIAMQED